MNSKGQITIPAPLRRKHDLHPGDEVNVVENNGALYIVPVLDAETRGQRMVREMTQRVAPVRSTDELMELLRGE